MLYEVAASEKQCSVEVFTGIKECFFQKQTKFTEGMHVTSPTTEVTADNPTEWQH